MATLVMLPGGKGKPPTKAIRTRLCCSSCDASLFGLVMIECMEEATRYEYACLSCDASYPLPGFEPVDFAEEDDE